MWTFFDWRRFPHVCKYSFRNSNSGKFFRGSAKTGRLSCWGNSLFHVLESLCIRRIRMLLFRRNKACLLQATLPDDRTTKRLSPSLDGANISLSALLSANRFSIVVCSNRRRNSAADAVSERNHWMGAFKFCTDQRTRVRWICVLTPTFLKQRDTGVSRDGFQHKQRRIYDLGRGIRRGIWGTEVPSRIQGHAKPRYREPGNGEKVLQKLVVFCKFHYTTTTTDVLWKKAEQYFHNFAWNSAVLHSDGREEGSRTQQTPWIPNMGKESRSVVTWSVAVRAYATRQRFNIDNQRR